MTRRRTLGRRQRHGEREWVGGRLSAPMYVTEGEPYRPDVILWLELPEGAIVGSDLVHPSAPATAVADVLTAAMQRPMIGSPRQPDRIRVADALLADVVAAAVGSALPIRVAPTPELDVVLQSLAESANSRDDADAEPASYLEGGRVPPQAVAELFRVSELLFAIAPWRHVSDGDVLRVDIPQLGVDGMCLSIIGALGESMGILLFPSLAGFDAFVAAAERSSRGGRIDLGTSFMSLSFEPGADIPAAMRREIAAHGWPVASASAYPRVMRRERDGLLRPLGEKDMRIVTACASAVSAFGAKHGAQIGRESFGPVCESYTNDEDLTVRLTLPYEAADLIGTSDAPASPPPIGTRVGRNDPCPCGSGKKYKRCHLGAASAVEPDDDAVVADDPKLVGAILQWGSRRFGSAWATPLRDIADEGMAGQLVAPWLAYHATAGGRRIVEHFLEAEGRRLSADERAWIASQLDAWLSIWEVTEVEPGAGCQLSDLLSGESRYVRDRTASRTLVRRDTLLARVVEHRGSSNFGALAPRILPPADAAEVVRRVRARLRLRHAVPVERLRDEALGRFMFTRWEEAVADLEHRASIAPILQNTDGDSLLFTTEHYAIDGAARREVEARLVAIGAIAVSEPTESAHAYEFHQPGSGHDGEGATIIGRARVTDTTLAVETNSAARADHLRQRVAVACGDLIRHRLREHADPRASFARAGNHGELPPAIDSAEQARIGREFKQRHYQRWLDEPVPALDGRTPREAVRSSSGRHRVDVLLRDIENRENRLPIDQRVDFAPIRQGAERDRVGP
ncbi:MAG: SEC-C metal-binding domain-containing protein, partial [bacterium]